MGYQITEYAEHWKQLVLDGAQICPQDRSAVMCFAEQQDFAVLELRGLPFDTPRHFDPVTLQGESVGGAAVLIRSDVLEAVGGLDGLLPPRAAMQDLSARLRAAGVRMGYCPLAAVQAQPSGELEDYLARVEGDCLLACKYGTAEETRAAWRHYAQTIRAPQHFAGVRKRFLAGAPGLLARAARIGHCSAQTLTEVTAPRELRGRCRMMPFEQRPLVSVVIRTHKRREVLRRTLQCLYWQTYKNFEIVIVEDGENTAEEMLRRDFAGLNIRYFNTGAPVGRGRAGNIGIEKSRGEYVCFLDDDDYFYPDYIELNLAKFMESGADLIVSSIMAFEIDVHSRDPFEFDIRRIYPVIFDHLDLMDMCIKCRIPMTGAMFRRELYDAVGGMREDIDGDEDWAMWLRYWKIAKRIDDTVPDIPRAVSMFGYPADAQAAQERLAAYEVFDDLMLADEDLNYELTAEKLQALIRQKKRDLGHLYRIGALEETLRTRRPEKAWQPPQAAGPLRVTARQLNGLYHALLCRAADCLEQGTLAAWLEEEGI